ncbi:MAG TPA: hypothetical protein VG456_13350 [Candidatus Sulfopaludibacter sp.]|jgi:hypothetical protein|nr:hypothetical protein [Candidatus Sulfopaludibacter sp.]
MAVLRFYFALLPAVLPVAAQVLPARDLLAKAQIAFSENQRRDIHWNWTTTEVYLVLDAAEREKQRLPVVTVESVIRKDGRRCNAVLSWGDGVEPYQVNGDADARCAGQDPVEPPLRIASLLQSLKATVEPSSGDFYTVALHHDKARVHDERPEVRCTASVEATVRLDRTTLFPVHVEGKLVDSGCEGVTTAALHYGDDATAERSQRALFKGTTFRMDFALQKDKYGHQENSYWISTDQHWSCPVGRAAAVICYNRRFVLTAGIPKGYLVKDIRTTAQEFGAQSSTRFDSVPK